MSRFGEERNPDRLIPVVVDCRVVSKKVVETRPRRLGVEIKFKRLGVETKFNKFGEETNPDREIPVVVD